MTTCRSCGARIMFLLTAAGRRIPVNFDTVQPEDTHLDLTRHIAHFATCPQAEHHRRPR